MDTPTIRQQLSSEGKEILEHAAQTELSRLCTPSHAERVAQRWDGLEQRIDNKIASMSLDGQAIERLLTQAVRSGSRVKKIMWLRRAAEAVADQALRHAACRQGCTHCCHIAVVVTKAEALQIAAETGCYVDTETGKPMPMEAGAAKDGNAAHWQGIPCSFLNEGDCSIYRHRPLACRLQLNMDDDDLLCQLVDGESIRVPYLNLMTHHVAAVVALGMGQPIADIRQWFPRGAPPPHSAKQPRKS